MKLETTPSIVMRAKHTVKLKVGDLSLDFTSPKGLAFETFIYFMLGHFKTYAGVEALTEIRDTITKSINMSHRFDNGQAYDLIPVDIIDEYAEGARIGVGLLNLGTTRVTNIQYGQAVRTTKQDLRPT